VSRPAFLGDNDLRESIVVGVRRREPTVTFTRVRQHGMRTASDEAILAFAAERGLIVVTQDVNTMTAEAYRRISRQLPMAGLAVAREEVPVGPAIESLLMIWAASEAEEWRDRVEYLPL
jgi:hypothetical protein